MSKEQIKAAISYANLSQAAVADRLNVTRQAFTQKNSRETWTQSELEEIARAIGAKYISKFVFPDGMEI